MNKSNDNIYEMKRTHITFENSNWIGLPTVFFFVLELEK